MEELKVFKCLDWGK